MADMHVIPALWGAKITVSLHRKCQACQAHVGLIAKPNQSESGANDVIELVFR